MEEEESPLEREHCLCVLLPGGTERSATVHGSKPVMDLLVTLCASYHLNPAEYTVEVLSPNKNSISFKPNSPIGSLEADRIVLKPKAGEDKTRTPYMPEATVRLLINYNISHKAVVRVNPREPLHTLLPAVCHKCEFRVESTVLLRHAEDKQPLDLSLSLNQHGLRELYARDYAAAETQPPLGLTGLAPTKASSSSLQDLTKKDTKKPHNRGFLGLFRKHRKKSEPTHAVSAPSSPGPTKSRSASVSTHDALRSTTPSADLPKKRRAPPPPMGTFHSFPTNLSHLQRAPCVQTSGEGPLRSTKRRAPLPPPAAHLQDAFHDSAEDSLNRLEEESDLPVPPPVAPPPVTPPPSPPASLRQGPDPQRPPVRDPSDARAALAQVLTSSLTSGTLLRRLKNKADIEMRPDLPTEDTFQDPANRTGMTTFRVVPSRRASDVAGPDEGAVNGSEGGSPAPPSDETEPRQSNQDEIYLEKEDDKEQPVCDSKMCEDQTKADQSHDEEELKCEQKTNNSKSCDDEIEPTQNNQDPLHLGEKEVVKEFSACCPKDETKSVQSHDEGESKTNNSESCDDEIEVDQRQESVTNEGNCNLSEEGDRMKTDQNHERTESEGDLILSEKEEVLEPKSYEDEIKSEPSRENVTNEGNIDLGDDKVTSEKNYSDVAESNALDSETCDDRMKTGQSHDSELCLGKEEELHDPETSGPSLENVADEGTLGLGEEEELNADEDLYLRKEEELKVPEDEDSEVFPPPPPPVFLEDDPDTSVLEMPRASTNGHVRSGSEPLRSAPSAPAVERKASVPSRFAQAVAQAVQRSRLHSAGKTMSALLHQET